MDMGLQQFQLYRVCQIRANGPFLSEAPSNNGPLPLSGVMSKYRTIGMANGGLCLFTFMHSIRFTYHGMQHACGNLNDTALAQLFNLSPYLPVAKTSPRIVLCQLPFGLPLFSCHCVFHSMASFSITVYFLKVWPIQFHLRLVNLDPARS
jgi:hypothetical protein